MPADPSRTSSFFDFLDKPGDKPHAAELTGTPEIDRVTLTPSHGSYPVPEMIASGIWRALSPAARCLHAVLWDYFRQHPDACHPSRDRLASEAGLSAKTVTRALAELEAANMVKVIARPPAANTYRLNWQGVKLPCEAAPAGAPTPTPYKRPTRDTIVTLHLSEDGGETTSYDREGRRMVYVQPDGCRCLSASEVSLHGWLAAWQIPHLSNVPYSALGVRGLTPGSACDFVAGPRLVIEYFGLSRTQPQADAYKRKRREKEAAIKAAGWTLLAFEPGETSLSDTHAEAIAEAWASASIADAERLASVFASSDSPGKPNALHLLRLHLDDARKREAGEKPPEDRRSLYVPTPNGRGVVRRGDRLIVLCTAAGRGRAPAPVGTIEPLDW